MEGRFNKEKKIFLAEKVLAKHDENYMPPEIHKALEEENKLIAELGFILLIFAFVLSAIHLFFSTRVCFINFSEDNYFILRKINFYLFAINSILLF